MEYQTTKGNIFEASTAIRDTNVGEDKLLYTGLSHFETLSSLNEEKSFQNFGLGDTNSSIKRKEIQAIVQQLFLLESMLGKTRYPEALKKVLESSRSASPSINIKRNSNKSEKFEFFSLPTNGISIPNEIVEVVPSMADIINKGIFFPKKNEGDIYQDESWIHKITRRLNIFKTLSDRFSKKFYWQFSFEICKKILGSDKYKEWYKKGDVEFIFYTCLFICSKIIFDDGYLSLAQFCDVFGLRKKLLRETETAICIYLLDFDLYGVLKKYNFFGNNDSKVELVESCGSDQEYECEGCFEI